MGTFRELCEAEIDAIELHQITMSLGAALMAALGAVEIAVRNSISNQLESDFGISDWLRNPPAEFNWSTREVDNIRKAISNAQRSDYAKLTQIQKAALDLTAFPNGVPNNTPES